jgi:hypothetical protein
VRRRLTTRLATLTGVFTVAVGLWMPWIVVNPEYSVRYPRFYVSGMGYRIEAFDWWILGFVALCVGNAVDLSGHRDRVAGVGKTVAGVVVLLFPVLWVTDRGGLDCVSIPLLELVVGSACRYAHGPGVFVTALGGALLALAGGYQFLTATDE